MTIARRMKTRAYPLNLVRRPPGFSLATTAKTGLVLQRERLYPSECLRTRVRSGGQLYFEEGLGWNAGWAYRLTRAVLNVPTGLVFHNGMVLEESNARPGSAQDAAALSNIRFTAKGHLGRQTEHVLGSAETKFFLHDVNRNYHQWLEYTIPRLLQVKEIWPETVVLIADDNPGFLRDYLKNRGLEPIGLPPGSFSIQNLIVADGRRPYLPASNQIDGMRRFFLPEEPPGRRAEAERIFLSRVGNSRCFEGEKLLVSELKRNDWLVLTELDLRDFGSALALFQGTRVLAGFHGAGLSNALFTPPTSEIRELASEAFWKASYARLANYLGKPYSLEIVDSEKRLHQQVEAAAGFLIG